jgi:nitrogen regulatory protein PII
MPFGLLMAFSVSTNPRNTVLMENNYDLILAIVDVDQHDIVIEACKKVNAQAYTAFSTKGSIGKKTIKLLTVEIETPKEIIMVLTPQSKTKLVKDQIILDADLDNPANGILIILDVKELGGFSSLLNNLK